MSKFTDDQLREQHSRGLRDGELVALFQCTRQAIQQRRTKLRLKPNKGPRVVHCCKSCGTQVKSAGRQCRKCFFANRPSQRGKNALLHQSQILPIFEARASGESVKAIAERFGVKPITVYVVLQRRKWEYVPIPEDILARVSRTRSPRS